MVRVDVGVDSILELNTKFFDELQTSVKLLLDRINDQSLQSVRIKHQVGESSCIFIKQLPKYE